METQNKDHRVFAQVKSEGLTSPTTLGLGHFKGDATELFQGSSHAQARQKLVARKMIPKPDGMAMAAQEPMRASFERTEDTS